MPRGDFSLPALYAALDERRRARDMSWVDVAKEVNRFRTKLRPIAVSTMTSLTTKTSGEGDNVLQMLLWLGRSPESFMPGIPDADAQKFQLPQLRMGQIVRWDTRALFAAANAQRKERQMTWVEVAREIHFTAGMLTNLPDATHIGFPRVMRLVRWLGQPAVTFTRIARW